MIKTSKMIRIARINIIKLISLCFYSIINSFQKLNFLILFVFTLVSIITYIIYLVQNSLSVFSKEYYFSKIKPYTHLSEKSSSSATTIFCIILTHPNNFFTKASAINQTWAPNCNNYRFISTIPTFYLEKSHHSNKSLNGREGSSSSLEISHPMPILQPRGFNTTPDEYSELSDKVFAAFVAVFELYPDYDWYLKADDDTFVLVDNLRTFLTHQSPNESVTCGMNAYDSVFRTGMFRSGGAGYVLSRPALSLFSQRLFHDPQSCSRCGVEDVDMALCLKKLNVKVLNSVDSMGLERFHSDSIDKVLFIFIIFSIVYSY